MSSPLRTLQLRTTENTYFRKRAQSRMPKRALSRLEKTLKRDGRDPILTEEEVRVAAPLLREAVYEKAASKIIDRSAIGLTAAGTVAAISDWALPQLGLVATLVVAFVGSVVALHSPAFAKYHLGAVEAVEQHRHDRGTLNQRRPGP